MAGRIKAEDVTYVRDHSALDDVVSDYVQLKNAGGGQKKGLCPFHDKCNYITTCLAAKAVEKTLIDGPVLTPEFSYFKV